MLKYGLFSTSALGWMTANGTISSNRGLAVRFTSYDEAVAHRDACHHRGYIAVPSVWLIVAWKE